MTKFCSLPIHSRNIFRDTTWRHTHGIGRNYTSECVPAKSALLLRRVLYRSRRVLLSAAVAHLCRRLEYYHAFHDNRLNLRLLRAACCCSFQYR